MFGFGPCYNSNMKKCAALLVFVVSVIFAVPVHAGVNDFYFSDFTGDYYLTKDDVGVSHLRVVENVTAVFPDFEQNKGICRQIPFTNQNGKNLTLSSLDRSNLTLLRNGAPEPIYSIEKEGNYYNVCTGTDDYVLGEQTYTFEYEFEKVVTDFGDHQELYWDTNGNGATQRFDKVTARVHFEDLNEWTGESWCYVGSYGESGQDRCTTTKTDDGVSFTATNLRAYENLTFDTELKPGSFVIPEPEDNYTYVWLTVLVGTLCVIVVGFKIRKYLKSRDKANYYKGLFVKPEYQPHTEYSLPGMAEIYLGKKKDVKVAMLLELAVNRKIDFIKGGKKSWSISVKDLSNVSGEYVDLLAILNGGTAPAAGQTIEVKRRTATSKLISLKKSMEDKILGKLKRDKLVEEKYHIGGSSNRGFSNVLTTIIVAVPIILIFGVFLLAILEEWFELGSVYGQNMVFYDEAYKVMFFMIVLAVMIYATLSNAIQKYAGHTMRGLEMSRFMEGLELYIRMAEADRLKFLQSIDGVDTSSKGIVKLYEKLLPYAALFGLEESWMDEMKQYCELKEIEQPDYLLTGITAAEMSRAMHHAASYINTATTMSSSGGGSSSGFSGGGGGFSGGGGGGGGFSGR